ncbi:MAG: hypothetical protein PHG06_20650 [Parabacteroides sp.]|nr:hypothetical protein [Parabacteroides sp.]
MENESKKKSVFMQMHDGERSGEGSFNVGLQKLFYLADISNKRKLVAAFPEFFGEEVSEFGVDQTDIAKITQELYGNKMNTHFHKSKGVSRQNLEESLKDSAQMISCLSPLIYEISQKYQGNIQQDNNGQPSAFRLRLQFQKYDIEFSFSQFHEALNDADSVYDRL